MRAAFFAMPPKFYRGLLPGVVLGVVEDAEDARNSDQSAEKGSREHVRHGGEMVGRHDLDWVPSDRCSHNASRIMTISVSITSQEQSVTLAMRPAEHPQSDHGLTSGD